MNPTLPYKKHSLSLKKQRQSVLRKQARLKHSRNNSMMMNFLQIKGTERQNDSTQRPMKSSQRVKVQESIHEWIQRQFSSLKSKIQVYCQIANNNFVQHQKIQESLRESDRCKKFGLVSEDQILQQLMKRIRSFLKQHGVEQIEIEDNLKKIESLTKSSKKLHIEPTKISEISNDARKIQDVQVLNILKNYHIEQNLKAIDYQNISKKSNTTNINPSLTGQQFYSSNFVNSLPISCSSTISQILYKQAHENEFSHFHSFCQRILLEKKPIISEFHFFKKEKLEKTNFYLGEINRKLNLLNSRLSFAATGEMNLVRKENISNSNAIGCNAARKDQGNQKSQNIGQQIDEICIMLKKLNQFHNLNSLIFDCPRPCCKSPANPPPTSTKAKILLNLKQAAKKSLHYKTEITDEYFNRYYNKDSFDRTRIYSLSKTKTEQMEQLQKTYYKNKDNRKACKKRCHSLFDSFGSH